MMTSRFRCVAVVGRPAAPTLPTLLPQLAGLLRAQGIRVITDRETAAQAVWEPDAVLPQAQLSEQADLAIAAGGDGTLLGLARLMVERDVPLIGINLGRLGFLTDIPANEITTVLPPILAGEYLEEPRHLLAAALIREGRTVAASLAMNDVVIARGQEASMIEFSVSINQEFVYSLRADGLILATPTGSTAYALSAGGPILHPQLAAIALVPIAPHSLSNRPVVVPANSQIEVAVVRGDALANFDVHSSWRLVPDDRVTTTVFTNPLRLLHPCSYRYYGLLRTKLHWNERPA
jgi:NAD+ kinase